MQSPPRIAYRGFEPSPGLKELVEERVGLLEHVHPDITTCWVVIDQPHHHQRKGNHWRVHVSVGVPGGEIDVRRLSDERSARLEDLHATVRDAFDMTRRRLQDHARKLSGKVKHHEEAPVARIHALGADHGFLSTPDGRELYFHAHSVIDTSFDDLAVGAVVTFVEEDGLEGPQASTVRVLDAHPAAHA